MCVAFVSGRWDEKYERWNAWTARALHALPGALAELEARGRRCGGALEGWRLAQAAPPSPSPAAPTLAARRSASISPIEVAPEAAEDWSWRDAPSVTPPASRSSPAKSVQFGGGALAEAAMTSPVGTGKQRTPRPSPTGVDMFFE